MSLFLMLWMYSNRILYSSFSSWTRIFCCRAYAWTRGSSGSWIWARTHGGISDVLVGTPSPLTVAPKFMPPCPQAWEAARSEKRPTARQRGVLMGRLYARTHPKFHRKPGGPSPARLSPFMPPSSVHGPILRTLLFHPRRVFMTDDNRSYRGFEVLAAAFHLAQELP